jgi:hypothetical protein
MADHDTPPGGIRAYIHALLFLVVIVGIHNDVAGAGLRRYVFTVFRLLRGWLLAVIALFIAPECYNPVIAFKVSEQANLYLSVVFPEAALVTEQNIRGISRAVCEIYAYIALLRNEVIYSGMRYPGGLYLVKSLCQLVSGLFVFILRGWLLFLVGAGLRFLSCIAVRGRAVITSKMPLTIANSRLAP